MSLPAHLIEVLERDESTAYVLNSEFRILYCNPAWDRFAAQNGGSQCSARSSRGQRVLDAMVEPLRAFYEAAFRESYRTGEQWEHSYECSSPALYRRFRLRILPLLEDAALVGINFLEAEYPHGADRPAMPGDENRYRREDGLIAMCANCRRTRRAVGPEVWDWVPSFVAQWPVNLTHGLCPICSMHFFPGISAAAGASPDRVLTR